MSAPSVDRLLQVRRGERVVDDDERAVVVGDVGDRLDVDAGEQRVGRRLQPHHRRCRRASRERARRGRSGRRPSTGARAGPTPCRSGGTCRRRRRCRAGPVRPDGTRRRMLSSAASPLANASPWRAASSEATQVSSAERVGLPEREYSKPLCPPTPSWANVVDSEIGVTTAPVAGSGSWPAWTARVSKPQPVVPRLTHRCTAAIGRSAGAPPRSRLRMSVRVSTLNGRPPDSTSSAGAASSIATASSTFWPTPIVGSFGPITFSTACPSPTGRGRSPPSAPARRPSPTPRRRRTAACSCTPGAG